MAASILSVVLMIVAVVAYFVDSLSNSRQMLIALETTFVVQLTYMALLPIGELNPLFIQLAKGLKWIMGYDIMLDKSYTTVRELLGVGVNSIMLSNNINVSIVIVVILAIFGAVLLGVGKLMKGGKNE